MPTPSTRQPWSWTVAEWIQSNIAGLAVALDPLISARADKPANPGIEAVGSRLTAAQLGGAMAWLSGKVLGQYEAFTAPGKPGRLLLVAPNIVLVERELELVPRDFRYWVCLHEETHRAQFGGVPWMQDHFLSEVQAFVSISDLSMADFMARLGAVAQSVVGAARGRPGPSLMEAFQTPAQREIFDRLTGLMSLLEGHADYVMDEVGPDARAHGRADPGALRSTALAGGDGRRLRAPHDGPGDQDAPVHQRRGLRAHGDRHRW